ncbi:neurotensin receptor type 2 [Protopterus annectens]|uniref:neurotensin receptor type 2 n=1 Tax=Protopterus annectens TaxID=7888 RepID=UPI001CFB44FE|nr:neurotensin receptor type 2 [Protopterus annectens]
MMEKVSTELVESDEMACLDKLASVSSSVRASTMAPNMSTLEEELGVNTHLSSKIFITVVYTVIFFVGTIGNSLTIYVVIKKNSIQNLHSTVHYHLVSLALSDLLILIISIPIELYNFIWVHYPWIFGDLVCRGYYFLRDLCSYATILNIASLSFERYLAICRPIRAKRIMSKSRTKKLLSVVWLSSLCFACPMAFIMGEKYGIEMNGQSNPSSRICTTVVSSTTIKVFIQVNVFASFLLPLSVISVLNSLIANRLMKLVEGAQLNAIPFNSLRRKVETKGKGVSQTKYKKNKNSQNTAEDNVHTSSRKLPPAKDEREDFSADRRSSLTVSCEPNRFQTLQHSVRVLRAIVIAYVICWLPYHARRLMYCYVPTDSWSDFLYTFYHYFYMLTNTLFYVSSAVNPVLYNVVSSTFRKLFFETLAYLCKSKRQVMKSPQAAQRSQSIKSNMTVLSSQTTEIVY